MPTSARTARVIDAAAIAGVVATNWYPSAVAAPLLGRSQVTVSRLARAGKLEARPDPLDPRRVLVSGRSILALVGGLLMDAAPAGPTESEKQREARARASLAEALDLAKRKTAAG